MLLMRPEAAHRVTVFGSTRKSAATSPGVRRRSLLPSTISPPISVSEHVFSVAKTSVYFLVFPKNEPLVSLVSFGFCRVGRSAGSAAQACWPISPAVHGKWRDVPAGAAGVAQCAVHDYRKCQALLSAREDYREFADSGAGATDLVCGNPVSGVADVAGGYGTRESGSCADALRSEERRV